MTVLSLADLGWSAFFRSQIGQQMPDTMLPARVCDVHRDRVSVKSESGDLSLILPPEISAGDLAVGDWVLTEIGSGLVHSVLERRTVLRRRGAGTSVTQQLIAANVDTLMIVTSCNEDFNPARLERYLALASSSDTLPLIVLTKADLAEDPGDYQKQAERLSPLAMAISIDARDPESLKLLSPWLKPGETAALVGSSGVGKSTILNGLTGLDVATQGIREDDAKGRHTTTARSLRRTFSGGWLVDTPGMRSLSLSDSTDGISKVFADLEELAASCKFSDCAHESEPGCAIRAAIDNAELDSKRLHRWQKLLREDRFNTETIAEARARQRGQTRFIKATIKGKRRMKD